MSQPAAKHIIVSPDLGNSDMKVQRLMGEYTNDNPNTSAQQPINISIENLVMSKQMFLNLL